MAHGWDEFVVVDGKEGKSYGYVSPPVFSPDSKRVAYVAEMYFEQFMVVDGEEQEKYDGVDEDSLIFSPDSQRMAYVAYRWGDADKPRAEFVVVDGKEGKGYGEIIPGSLIFSPDSKRLAYVADTTSCGVTTLQNEKVQYIGDKQFVVVDGQEQKLYDDIRDPTLIFSPDSKRVAYAAVVGDPSAFLRGTTRCKDFMVVDGKEGSQYNYIAPGSPTFSPDSQRVAYVVQTGTFLGWEAFIVVDVEEQEKYDGFGRLIFSPDSQRVAYVAYRWEDADKRWAAFVVVDGKEGKHYRRVSHPVFSPDSQRVAYVAHESVRFPLESFTSDVASVVVDGVEGKPYDSIVESSIIFDSADSFHYLAIKRGDEAEVEVYLVRETIRWK